METRRVQTLGAETTLEVTEQTTVKRVYRESRLLEQKAYFEALIAKGQAGLADVMEKLADIEHAKG
jgi:hypothetical protein